LIFNFSTVIEAKNLHKIDMFGKCNPYVCVYVLSEVQPRAKSKVIKKTLDPVWHEMLEM